MKCVACGKKIWFWDKIGFNGFWHWQCTKAWSEGYTVALDFAGAENRNHGFKPPIESYWDRMRVKNGK